MVALLGNGPRRPAVLRGSGRYLLRAVSARRPLIHAAAVGAFMAAAAGSALAQSSGRPITAAIVFLLGVTIAGALEGVWGGVIAALAASVSYNFFLIEPAFRFSLATLEDYAPLIAFNVSAAASGYLTGRLKDRAYAAELAAQRVSALLDLSEKLQAAVGLPDVLSAIRAFAGAEGRVDFELYICSGQTLRPVQGEARYSELAERVLGSPAAVRREGSRAAFRLSTAEARVGALVLDWKETPARDPQEEDLSALANLVSIAVERCLLLDKLSEAELIRKSEAFKTALLSSVSHDLRTPLSAISASASSLARYGASLPDEAKSDMLEMIQEQCRRLDRYTTNLLSLGRLQAGLEHERFILCDPIEALGSAILQVRSLGGDYEIIKRIDAPEALVRADPVMLEQVFYNVLENSVRYSDPGSPITVSATLRRSSLLVSIRDVGRGIPSEEFGRIFDRFYQARSATPYEGSGLGLAIAKGFTEAFKGRIWAGLPDDEAGGTIVTIELPVEDRSSLR